ncbi:unnamed protein product, partial [Meganyctiphanes norvegica]
KKKKKNMGISLQQYRAAIGKWLVGRLKRPKDQSLPTNHHADFCTTDYKEGEYRINHQKRLWKILVILLFELVIVFELMINQYHNRSMADINYRPCTTFSSKKIIVADHTAATGGIIPFHCQKALLVMAGVEQNPGPGSDIAENMVKKHEDIIAELCTDAPNNDVRDCLRLYNPKNNLRQHKAEFGKSLK